MAAIMLVTKGGTWVKWVWLPLASHNPNPIKVDSVVN